MSIASGSQIIFDQIHKIRPKSDVTLVAVSKYHSAQSIERVYRQGVTDFGESYLQEALKKQQQLTQYEDIVWHFIGPIQSNKTRQIANHFDWVQSVDRVKILARLNQQRSALKAPLNILLQVNISAESAKSGVLVEDLPALVEYALSCENLCVRGLMCIPQKIEHSQQQTSFKAMKGLFEQYLKSVEGCRHWDTLSMGMSSDYLDALTAGSTMLRIGTSIFGPREYK